MARHSGVVALFLLGSALAAPGCGGQSVLGEGEGDPIVLDGGAFGVDGGTGGVGGAAGGVGGSGGVGGTIGAAPGVGGAAPGVGGAPGGLGGTAGGVGGSSDYFGDYVPSCDLQVALSKSCARTGCHSAIDHYADLNFFDIPGIPAMLLDQPATHGDINCAQPGMPFRECMPSELPATCPPNALLLDSANPENSWVLRKLRGDESCGDAMPLPPGNSVSNGWNEARRLCLEDYFLWIAKSKAGTRSGAD
jgi:hypothetical protein